MDKKDIIELCKRDVHQQLFNVAKPKPTYVQLFQELTLRKQYQFIAKTLVLWSADANNKSLLALSQRSASTFAGELMQQTVFRDPIELSLQALPHHEYMPRVNEVNKPCRWLNHCNEGKCSAFTVLNGNYYCARKDIH